jgi:hypothetical protein
MILQSMYGANLTGTGKIFRWIMRPITVFWVRQFSTALDSSRQFSPVLGSSRQLLTVLDSSRQFSTVLASSRQFSTVLDSFRQFSTQYSISRNTVLQFPKYNCPLYSCSYVFVAADSLVMKLTGCRRNLYEFG